jgi:hypothetical protein
MFDKNVIAAMRRRERFLFNEVAIRFFLLLFLR